MFITDAQTISDIDIFGGGGDNNTVFSIYNRTSTRGGASVLEELFRYPLSDAAGINSRSGIIKHFADEQAAFPFERELFDTAEQYLTERDERTRLSAKQLGLGQKLSEFVAADTGYKNIVRGITSLIEILQALHSFMDSETVVACTDYAEERKAVVSLLSETAFMPLLAENVKSKQSYEQLAAYDSILRFRHHAAIKKLLQYIYRLDVYLSVAQVATARGYAFASAMDNDGQSILNLEDVKHPGVTHAKGNDIIIDSGQNIVFLTGANMAGKSTFMKSAGIAIYVAHVGFPVAAKKMTFAVLDGMFSTINLPDNLGMGASHFYAEVLRVKKVAKELSTGKRLFVLFDELFRGTNVKDANEATIAVTAGFARKTRSLFIISTHIIEAGEVLRQKSNRIQYRFLPTKMDGHKPVYTYKLEEGITEDRHGMVIIRNERIIEMLEERSGNF